MRPRTFCFAFLLFAFTPSLSAGADPSDTDRATARTLAAEGHEAYDKRFTPVQVASLGATVVGASAGAGHTCAPTADGLLWCWGANGSGQLGDGTGVPKAVPTQTKVSCP